MKKILICAFVVCVTAAFAEDMPRVTMTTAQSNGMGGHHVAFTDNVFGLLVNPAAIMRVEQRSFFALSPVLYSPETTFKLINGITGLMGGDMGALGDAANVISKQNGKIPLGFEVREFPLSVAWVADGFGFGLWNRVFVNPTIINTNISIDAYADVMLPVGFAFKILETDAHTVDAGITVKPFVRTIAHVEDSILNLMDSDKAEKKFKETSVPLLAGAGFDIGFLYRWDIGFSAGLTFNDIVTRAAPIVNLNPDYKGGTPTYQVPFSMNLGVAYELKLGRYWKSAPGFLGKSSVAFMFDWRDVTNVFYQDQYATHRNALLDLGAGIQISLADMFKIRAGMSEMLPAVGLGVDLGPVEISAAYYGKEFGLDPGVRPAAALDLTIAVRPGAKKRDWPWTRRSLVGLIQGKESASINSAESDAENAAQNALNEMDNAFSR